MMITWLRRYGSRALGTTVARRWLSGAIPLAALLVYTGPDGLRAQDLEASPRERLEAALEGRVFNVTFLEVGRNVFVYGTVGRSASDELGRYCRDATTLVCRLFPDRAALIEWRIGRSEKHRCKQLYCSDEGRPVDSRPLPRRSPNPPSEGRSGNRTAD